MNLDLSNPEHLEAQFIAEMQELHLSHPTIQMEISSVDLWMLLSAVQLASRHPVASQTAAVARATEIMRDLQEQLPMGPAMQHVAQQGWNPDADVEETPY